jgi:hypothetical protein
MLAVALPTCHKEAQFLLPDLPCIQPQLQRQRKSKQQLVLLKERPGSGQT